MDNAGNGLTVAGGRSGGAELPMWKKSLAGGFAGISTALVLTPVEFVKCRMQVVVQCTGRGLKRWVAGATHRRLQRAPVPLLS